MRKAGLAITRPTRPVPPAMFRPRRSVSRLLAMEEKMAYPRKEGDLLKGKFEVRNVVGSSKDKGDKEMFWSRYTGRNFHKQKCGIKGCGRDAEVGGHVWVKRLSKFCYILPICQSHNESRYLNANYQWTKAHSCLVARNKRDFKRQ